MKVAQTNFYREFWLILIFLECRVVLVLRKERKAINQLISSFTIIYTGLPLKFLINWYQ